MEVGVVKKQIKNNDIRNFYIFTGDEVEAQRIYVNKIAEISNRDIQYIDSVAYINGRAKSLLAKPKCFVCRDDREFMKNEKAWTSLGAILGDNMLILYITEVDKRTKFYKHFSDDIVCFNYMGVDTLKKYVLRQINLSDRWLSYFIDICEYDYSRILLEIDKLKRYSDSSLSYDKALSDLVTCGAIYVPPMDAIFDFVDAFVRGDSARAFSLLDDCKRIGEPALRLITVLYSTVKRTLQVQACPSKDVSGVTGLSAWEIKTVSDKIGYRDDGDLVEMLQLLQYVEKSIKLGEIEDAFAMDYIMTKCL